MKSLLHFIEQHLNISRLKTTSLFLIYLLIMLSTTILVGCNVEDTPMIEIPAGEFVMGISHEDVLKLSYEFYERTRSGRVVFEDEQPRLLIFLPDYEIDRLEVTNAQYRFCIRTGECPGFPTLSDYLPSGAVPPNYDPLSQAYESYPAFVTAQGAQAYCRWKSKRLPTEAEWEKAARGTDERLYPWGNEWDADWDEERKWHKWLLPVGSYPKDTSPYGVLDMAGNAWEWTGSPYQLYPGFTQIRPDVPDSYQEAMAANHLAVRALPLYSVPSLQKRTTVRWHLDTQDERMSAGFRCVKGAEPASLEDVIIRILDIEKKSN